MWAELLRIWSFLVQGMYLGFDFGMRRIGVAVGQKVTASARPLVTLEAKSGIPVWDKIQRLVDEWRPLALIVGLPLNIDDSEQYITTAARAFAHQLKERFHLSVHLVDERLTTVEARSELFNQGGYRKIQKSAIDSFAAQIILEQWLKHPD